MFVHDGEKYSLCVACDISERKRLEEVLAAREQKFRSLVESFPDLIISYDRDGRIRYLNSAMLRELELVSAEACIGKRPGEFWPDGRFTEIEQAAKQVVESGAEITLEFPRPSPVGELRIHEVRIVPEQDVAGQIIGTIAVGRDITEHKRLEEELIKTEKLESLGVLAGGIAHDFNNLLMGIMGPRQILSYDPEACLIAASGYSDDPVMASPKEYGFRAVLAKPFTIGQLKEALSTLGVADAEERPLSQSFS